MIVATTLVGLLLVAVALVARRLRSDLEEAAWRLTSLMILAMPFASLLPKSEVAVRLPLVHGQPLYTLPHRGAAVDPFLIAAAIVYVLVALLLLGRLAVGVAAAARLRREATPFGEAFLSSSLRVPVTAGLFAPAILLPSDARSWSDDKLAAILAHERAHVRRRDPLWRFIAKVAAAVCWFHPLSWLAASAIERTAEEAADGEAVAATGDRHAYAEVVIESLRVMTRGSGRVFATGMLDGRTIGARIDTILQPAQRRRSARVTRTLLAAIAAGTLFITGMTRPEAPPLDALQRWISPHGPQMTEQEFFRKRGEIRSRFREELRETFQGFFR